MGATTAFEIEHITLVSIFGKLASNKSLMFPVYCMITVISLLIELWTSGLMVALATWGECSGFSRS